MKLKLLIILVLFLTFQNFSQINLVKDAAEGSRNGNPIIYAGYKNKIYFNVTNSSFQSESYAYNGVTLERIKDNDGSEVTITPIYIPENGANDPMIVIKFEGSLLKTFTYNGSTFTKISDLRPYGGGIKFNGKYYFTAQTGSNYPLFYTDGTEAGTGFLKEEAKTFVSFNVTERAVVNNTLVFVADTPENGRELWKTDGTEAGTTLLKDIYVGDKDAKPEDFFVTADKSKLFFTATTAAEGREIWVTDGTAAGTKLLKDIHNGTSGDDINSIIEMNGKTYFEANGKLWSTDGTPENTIEIADAEERYLIILNDELYFHDSKSMYKTDGTVAGTIKVNPDNIGVEWRSFPVLFKNEIYFGGSVLDRNNQIANNELWKTDGTTEGTVKVKVIDSDFPSGPSRFVQVGDELVFIGVTRAFGQELWRTDGTESGTMIIQDKAEGSKGFTANFTTTSYFRVLDNNLFFSGNANDGLGVELYEYKNGTTASTKNNLLQNVNLYYNNNTLYLKGLEAEKSSIKIYNILGKTIFNTDAISPSNKLINVNLKSGIYIANIKTEKGKFLSKKFVVTD